MTVYFEITIECELCHYETNDFSAWDDKPSIRETRKFAKMWGWTYRYNPNTNQYIDVCPECRELVSFGTIND